MKKFLFGLSFMFSSVIYSQEMISPEKLTEEIQQIKQTDSSLKLVWWIPTEYWNIAMQEKKNITPEQLNYIKTLFDDYTIIVAGDYSLINKNSEIEFIVNDVRKSLTFFDAKNQKVLPLKNEEIDENVLMLMNDVLKPLFEKMIGTMGSGVEIFIYNNKSSNGKRILDPYKSGYFKMEMGNEKFEWNLPLVSLMKQKTCEIDSKKFPGNYIYCPFHGTEL